MKRITVKEVTVDLSESMYGTVQAAFSWTTIFMDRFRVIRCGNAAVDATLPQTLTDAPHSTVA